MSDEFKVFGPPHMRMVELPLREVRVDPTLLCRRHSEEEIDAACALFKDTPMLHPPVVARWENEWLLAAGLKRFLVWQREGVEVGLFRWIDVQSRADILLTSLSENVRRGVRQVADDDAPPWWSGEGFEKNEGEQ